MTYEPDEEFREVEAPAYRVPPQGVALASAWFRPRYPILGWGNGEYRPRSFALGALIVGLLFLISVPVVQTWQWAAIVGLGFLLAALTTESAGEPYALTRASVKLFKVEWHYDGGEGAYFQIVRGACTTFLSVCAVGIALLLVAPQFMKGAHSPIQPQIPALLALFGVLALIVVADGGTLIRALCRRLLFTAEFPATWDIHPSAPFVKLTWRQVIERDGWPALLAFTVGGTAILTALVISAPAFKLPNYVPLVVMGVAFLLFIAGMYLLNRRP